jgi:DNA processing protein
MEDTALKYKIGITMIPGIGGILARRLLEHFQSAEHVFHAGKDSLLGIPGIRKGIVESFRAESILEKAGKEIEFLEKHKIRALFLTDQDFPWRLRNCPDSPLMLYVKGTLNLDHPKMISIVGTRQATSYGKDMTEELVRNLAVRGHDPVIVSGLAYGIDITAHRAALKNNLKTIAVLAHGLTSIYPSLHKNTAREIAANGALVTEFTSDQEAERPNFVKRNRIIAGMADATIVVESAAKGGSLITADIANSYNKDVFAFPGRTTDVRSHGTNKLIKLNRAALIEHVEDLEYMMGWDKPAKEDMHKQASLFKNLSTEEKVIINLLKENGEIFVDDICILSNLPVSIVNSLLFNLEFEGLVKSLPGKVYRLL